MRLLVNELRSSLYQEVTIGARRQQLYALRPHLYRHGNPSGSLYLQIQDLNGNTIDQSETLSISIIGTNTYWHGVVRFYISNLLKEDTSYRIVLLSTGYTFDESAYIGWVNDFDLRVIPATYALSSGYGAALLFEPWTNNEVLRGIG